jgi:hypothetical protein
MRMNYGRILLAGVVGTIVYFMVGGLVFGKLIAKYYAPYPGVYRSAEMVKQHIPIGLTSTFLAVLLLAAIYAVGYKGDTGIREGFRFGVLVGIFFACAVVGDEYVTLNIGRELAVAMAIGRVVGWVIVGTTIGLVYKPKTISG